MSELPELGNAEYREVLRQLDMARNEFADDHTSQGVIVRMVGGSIDVRGLGATDTREAALAMLSLAISSLLSAEMGVTAKRSINDAREAQVWKRQMQKGGAK